MFAAPASTQTPEEAAQHARADQRATLQIYHLNSPPDLSASGLELSNGLYRWGAGHAARNPYPSSEELGNAIETVLARRLRQNRLNQLNRLLPHGAPNGDLNQLSDQQLGFLVSYLSDHPAQANQFANMARLQQLTWRLRDGGDSLQTLSAFFENRNGAGGGAVQAYWARAQAPRQPGHNQTDGLRDAARPKGLVIMDMPFPISTVVAGVSSLIANASARWSTHESMLALKKCQEHYDEAEIVRQKEKLLPLTESKDLYTRRRTIYLLSRLHDESLAPIFLKHLKNMRGNRDEVGCGIEDIALRGIGDILGTYKADSPGADWSTYLKKAPRLLSTVVTNADIAGYEARHLIISNLSYLNLMTENQRVQFINDVEDPKAALGFIAASDSHDIIDEERGLHSSEAKLFYARFKQLAAGKPLSQFLNVSDLSSRAETSQLVARLQRYDLLTEELRTDPQFVPALTALMFSTSRTFGPGQMFSIGRLLWQTQGDTFAQALLNRIKNADDPQFDRHAALFYLALNEQHLTPQQKEIVHALGGSQLTDLERRALQNWSHVPFYDHWPKGPVNVALVMTQAEHAYDFLHTLESHGFQRTGKTRDKNNVERLELVKSGLRLQMEIFPSSRKGWAMNPSLLRTTMMERYRDSRYQVVAYRGHALNYWPFALEKIENKNKVFIDLSCDSAFFSQLVTRNCEDCAYFGTTTTGAGAVNNVFLLAVLESLASRLNYQQMQAKFDRELPRTLYRFTGTWSPASVWAK